MRRLKTLVLSSAVWGLALSLAIGGCRDDEGYLDGYEPMHQSPRASGPATGEESVMPPDHPTVTGSGGEPEDGRPAGHPTLRGDSRPASTPSEAAAYGEDASPDDPTVASFLGLEGPIPKTWTKQPPPNQMVHTNYAVPAAEGASQANINVFFFGQGMGGPVEDNVHRWAGQFRSPDGGPVEPNVETFEVDGMPVTFVELTGQYQGMGDPQPKPDQIMLSAIVDAPAGRLFIRLVGDAATIEHNREDYMNFIHGIHRAADR